MVTLIRLNSSIMNINQILIIESEKNMIYYITYRWEIDIIVFFMMSVESFKILLPILIGKCLAMVYELWDLLHALYYL